MSFHDRNRRERAQLQLLYSTRKIVAVWGAWTSGLLSGRPAGVLAQSVVEVVA